MATARRLPRRIAALLAFALAASTGVSAPQSITVSNRATLSTLTTKSMRCSDLYPFLSVPPELAGLPCVTVPRGDKKEPGAGYAFTVDGDVVVYLFVHDLGAGRPTLEGWQPTPFATRWQGLQGQHTDTVYMRKFAAGAVPVPPHDVSKSNGTHGIPHMAVVSPETIKLAPPGQAFESLTCLGLLRTHPSKEVAASPLSVGFETLDRKMFEPERTYGRLATLGVKWARVQTGWCRTETEKGKYDFQWLDEVVDSLRSIGIQPWFSVSYGNRLYAPDAPDLSAVGWVPIFEAGPRAAWTAYVEALGEHFKGRVKHFEIWNEPNLGGRFWRPRKPNAGDYTELVKLTAAALRKQVPDAVIIGGAFAGMPTGYLKAALDAGLGDVVDKISFHPYRPVPEGGGYADQVAAWRHLLAEYNPAVKLWQGENGAPSEKGSSGALGSLAWTEEAQARWVLRRILTDLSLGIELTSYFHTVDLVNYNWGNGSTGKTNYKGLLRGTDYTPKPSFRAYRNLCALFDADSLLSEFRPAVTAAGSGGKQALAATVSALFIRRGCVVLAYWQTQSPLRQARPISVDITCELPAGSRLQSPVLVDLLEGKVYRLPAPAINGKALSLPGLPMVNYPVVVTDEAALEVVPAE